MIDPAAPIAVLAALPYGIVLFDRQGHASLINPAAARILATDPEECLGLSRDVFAERFQLPRELGPERVWAGNYPARYLAQALQLSPEARAAGLSAGLLLMEASEELTLLKHLGYSLNFDVRPPLSSILSAATMLRRRLLGPLPEQMDELLGIAVGSATRLARVFEQTHRLIRFTDPSWAPEDSTEDLADLLRGLLAPAHPWKHPADPRWSLDLPAGPLIACTDSDLLIGVLNELLDNAGHYAGEGGRVTLRAWEEAGEIVISVGDTGPGLSPQGDARLRRALGLERSAPMQVERLGRGGLMMQVAVRKSRLQIAFESTPGVGTTVRVTVPRNAPNRRGV